MEGISEAWWFWPLIIVGMIILCRTVCGRKGSGSCCSSHESSDDKGSRASE